MKTELNRLTEVEQSGLELNSTVVPLKPEQELTDENLLRESLRMVRQAMEIVHEASSRPKEMMVETKEDGSPVTEIDKGCEKITREHFARIFPGIGFCGEEGNDVKSQNGYEVIMDPVDGTSAMISNEVEKVGVSLAVRQFEKLVLAVVGNPGTGEIVYAQNQAPTRCIKLSPYGKDPVARTLPDNEMFDKKGPRVMTRFRQFGQLSDMALQNRWNKKSVRHLTSPGGSPSLHLAEAAKGHYIYVHNWVRPSQLYDLTAQKLLENAGGVVVDMEGNSVDLENFKGTFIAGVDKAAVEKLRLDMQQEILTEIHHGQS